MPPEEHIRRRQCRNRQDHNRRNHHDRNRRGNVVQKTSYLPWLD
jgi:hypothetical protein